MAVPDYCAAGDSRLALGGGFALNLDAGSIEWWTGAVWTTITGGGTPPDADATTKGILKLAGDLAGTAASPAIAARAVTMAKLVAATVTDVLLGRATAGSGDFEEIACTALGRSLIAASTQSAMRTVLGLGALAVLSQVDTAEIVARAVTMAQLVAATTTDVVLGRSSAGSGDFEEIACTSVGRSIIAAATQANVRTILSLGGAALLNIGTNIGTAAAGDDARFLGGRSWMEPPGIHPQSNTQVTTFADDTPYAIYLGRAGKQGAIFDVVVRVTTAYAAGTYAEVALLTGTPSAAAGSNLTRNVSANVAALYNATGIKTVSLPSSCSGGEDCYVAFGSKGGTRFQLRGALVEDLASGVFLSAAVTTQLSTMGAGTAFGVESTVLPPRILVYQH